MAAHACSYSTLEIEGRVESEVCYMTDLRLACGTGAPISTKKVESEGQLPGLCLPENVE